MSKFVTYLMLIVLCLSPGPGSVVIISGQGRMTDAKVLEEGGDCQCASMEDRERARNKIHQIANSAILAAIATGHIHACNGTPGWRRVAFINMTDTSYNCMPYWTQLDIIFQKDMWTITHNSGRMFFNHIQCWRFTIQPCVWEDKGIPVWIN